MYTRIFALVLFVTAPAALPGTTGAAQSADPRGPVASVAPSVISGKVTNARGEPVEGAKVTLYEMTYAQAAASSNPQVVDEKSTGADGVFTLALPQAADPRRPRFVVARKEGLALGWAPGRMSGNKPLEITLGEGKDLAGQVVDDKGQPVVDAEVRIAAAMGGKSGYLVAPGFLCSKTDSNGRFVFANMPAEATFEFTVEKPGRATIGTLDRTTYRGGKYQFAPGQAGIRLPQPLEATIEGLVVEKVNGKPAGGVTVMALPDSRLSMLLSPKTATTAPDGRFRIGGLTAGAYIVRLPRSSDRIGPLMPGAYVPPASPEKTDGWVAQPVRVTVRAGETKGDLKLQLTTGGFIEVLVKDDAGKPVPGATVSVFQVEEAQSVGGQSFSERTDEKGLARIRVAAGRYVVAGIYKQGFARRMGVIRLTDAFAVEEGETRQIEQVLGAGPKVAGIVRDEAGNALAGVKLNILPMMVSPNEVTSDASGKFEMAWDPGMWGPQGTTFILVARDEARGLAEAVDLDEQGGALDVKLRPGVVVTGTVLDQEGRPLPEARAHVILQGSRWSAPVGRGAYAKAGPDGKFEIKAIPPDRQYTVSATAEGFGRTDVRFDAGGIKDNRFEAGRLKLIPANLSIAGIVVDPNDQPVEGANIYGFGEGQPSSREVQTDAEGKFTLKGVCPGSIRLQVTSRGPMPMFGTAQVEGGATDLRIVISSRATPSAYMPRRPNALKGKPLPSLKDLGIDLPADAEGKMLLVCFWDMGQRPSRYCLTQLAAQAAQLDGKGVLVVAIHAAKVEDGVLTQWAQKNEVPFKMGIMTGDIDKTKLAWGVASLPHLILTDKKHTVIAEGFSPGDLDKQIEIAAAP